MEIRGRAALMQAVSETNRHSQFTIARFGGKGREIPNAANSGESETRWKSCTKELDKSSRMCEKGCAIGF